MFQNALKEKVKFGMNRSYQRMKAGKKYFGILNKCISLKNTSNLTTFLIPVSNKCSCGKSGKNALWASERNRLEVPTVK
jgi:hypothetical protein